MHYINLGELDIVLQTSIKCTIYPDLLGFTELHQQPPEAILCSFVTLITPTVIYSIYLALFLGSPR